MCSIEYADGDVEEDTNDKEVNQQRLRFLVASNIQSFNMNFTMILL